MNEQKIVFSAPLTLIFCQTVHNNGYISFKITRLEKF